MKNICRSDTLNICYKRFNLMRANRLYMPDSVYVEAKTAYQVCELVNVFVRDPCDVIWYLQNYVLGVVLAENEQFNIANLQNQA